jgi:hypothetical protein
VHSTYETNCTMSRLAVFPLWLSSCLSLSRASISLFRRTYRYSQV